MVERKSKKSKKSKDKQKQKQKQKQTQSVKVNVNVKNINTRRTRTGFRPPFTSLRGQMIQRSVPQSVNVQAGGRDSALYMQQVALNNGLMAVTRNMNDIQNAITNLEQPPLATRSRSIRNNPVEELSIEGLRRERIRAFEAISPREVETPSFDRYSSASSESMMSGVSSRQSGFSMNIGSPQQRPQPQPQPPQGEPQPPQEAREAMMQRMSGEQSNLGEMVDDDTSSRLGSSEASSQSLPVGSSESGSSQSLQMRSYTDSEIDALRQLDDDETRLNLREAIRLGEVQDMEQEDIRSRAMRDERQREVENMEQGRIEQSMMEEQDINYARRNLPRGMTRAKPMNFGRGRDREKIRELGERGQMGGEDMTREEKERRRVARQFQQQSDRILGLTSEQLRENEARRQNVTEFFTQGDIEEEPPVLAMTKDDLDERERRGRAFDLEVRNQELANNYYDMSRQDRERLHAQAFGSSAIGSDVSSSLSSLGMGSSLGSVEEQQSSSAV